MTLLWCRKSESKKSPRMRFSQLKIIRKWCIKSCLRLEIAQYKMKLCNCKISSDELKWNMTEILFVKSMKLASFADVRIIYHRECDPLVCPSFSDLQGPWPDQAPVCASNGYTYGHIHQIRCLKDLQPGQYDCSNQFNQKWERNYQIIEWSAFQQIFEFFMKAVVHYTKRTEH